MKLEEAGVVWTYPNQCSPLEDMKIVFKWNGLNGQNVRFEILDANHQQYLEKTVKSANGEAEITVKPGGIPGVHYVTALAYLANKKTYRRCGSFRVEARTHISSDNEEIDGLLKLLEEGLRQAIDVVKVKGKPITYHKAADNTWENLAYPAFPAPALRYFIQDMKTMFEVIYDNQWPNGRLPDHIYGDGSPGWHGERKIRSCMADLETGMVSTLYRGWQAHGDDDWVRKLLPKMEAGLQYVTSDPMMYDEEYGVIKRPHTCDEWDFQIFDGGCFVDENSLFVVMQGDTGSLYEACGLLAELHVALGDGHRANYWREQQNHYCEVGNRIFWDGVKYRHHIHLDPVDHGDFDEDEQLAMSNSWAITRGLADHEKAVSIINEYMRRLGKTGNRFPWWSLQPGYPDELGYFRTTGGWSKKQGEYANGGLFPWVGGELCRGAFDHGMEKVAYGMLRDFYSVIKRDNGAVFTWYDLDGNAAINASYNQTNYDAWGMTPWTQALIEGLAGIRSNGKLFEDVLCSPRWSVTKTKKVAATAHFPASDTYFAYTYALSKSQIRLFFTGTGKEVSFHILLPSGKDCRRATVDGENTEFETENLEFSQYVNLQTEISGTKELVLSF